MRAYALVFLLGAAWITTLSSLGSVSEAIDEVDDDILESVNSGEDSGRSD